jgi:hypothetical protein
MPVSTPSVINPDVSLSDTGYQAMALHKQSNLLNDIQKIVHNEILANRMMDVSVKNAPDNSMGNRCNSDSSMGNSSMGNSSMGNSSMGDSSMGDSSMGNSSMGDSSMGNRCNSDSSDSCDQERMHHDMSKYIKKDEIPCWGCSIDY